MPAVHVNGVDLHYEIDGPAAANRAAANRAGEAAPTIVFAHGGEGTHLHWWQQVGALRATHRCVTYDARGFGLSGTVPSADGFDAHRTDLLGLLDALDIRRAVLVGQSMGGWAVSGVALARPERVAGLVMADTPFNLATPELSQWSVEMLDKLHRGFDVIAACVAPSVPQRCPEMHYLFQALGRLNPPRTGPRGLDAYELFRDQPPGDYSSFGVPSLFIVGEDDQLTFPWLIRATAGAIPRSRFELVPGAGHSVYWEQPEVFNTLLRDFVAAVW
jgi:3-oxoadipate enol-lactonase